MSFLFSERPEKRRLWPHQERTLSAIRAAVAAGEKRILVQLPTGAGKTEIARRIVEGALAKGNRVAFTVPLLSLVAQTVAAFEAGGIDAIGVMQANHPRTDATQPVQIVSAPTLSRRSKPDVEIVVVDEAHLNFKAIHKWMAEHPHLIFVGLSATPWTRGLGRHYESLIIGATTRELVYADFLCPFTVFAPSEPDLSGVRTVAGDYHEGELAKRCNTDLIVGDVIEQWLLRGENRPTLCYGVDRAHALHLKQRFDEAGVAAEYIDCFTDRVERERIFDRFRRGDVRVICNVATLAVGIDLPGVSCVIDARPTKSEMAFVQRIGRGLRTAPGKDKLLIFDHAGNHLRLGLVTDIHHDRLDDGKPRSVAGKREKRSTPPPRLCDECKAVMPQSAMRCDQCGARREAKSGVQHVDGELVELGSGKSSKSKPTVAEQSTFFAELRWIARERGYRDGWAAHKFKERFGVWPDDYRIRNAIKVPPSLKTKGWVTSRNIARTRASG